MTTRREAALTPDEQLRLWVAGEPVHNIHPDRGPGGECCPDFSCCSPELLAPTEARRAFAEATPEEQEKMLGGFLSRAVSGTGAVVITDRSASTCARCKQAKETRPVLDDGTELCFSCATPEERRRYGERVFGAR